MLYAVGQPARCSPFPAPLLKILLVSLLEQRIFLLVLLVRGARFELALLSTAGADGNDAARSQSA